jgi:hypothetical protein|tara:strand:+ start:216 stop:443 length:228 start_codon:yes stop_codon:yes gene_type:complete
MTREAIKYAMKRLRDIENDNDHVTFHEKIDQLGIYVEFRCGKNVSISDDEIYYQAEEYLNYQAQELLGNKKRALR